MKYLLDFDRTVFDMDRLYQAIQENNPKAAVGTVASLEGIDLTQFLFRDAVEFFNNHHKDDIYIVSSCYGTSGQWDMSYQEEKIARSRVSDYVQEVFVVNHSKVETIRNLALSHEDIIFVDDHPEHIKSVSTELPEVITVHLNRAGTLPINNDVPSITTLQDVDAIIAA